MKISGKTALVLGATRGIGRAIATSLADEGAKIIAPFFDWPESCEETFAELQSKGPGHIFFKADLRDPGQVKNLFSHIGERCSALDILVNNIERGGMPVVHGPYTGEQWDLEMDTSIKAKWQVFQQALPLLKKAPEGTVINISSIAGIVGRSGPAGLIFNDAYSAANRAVSSFTETWAREAAPTIRVNEVMLGFIDSRHGPGTRGWDLLSKDQKRAVENHTLLRRTGRVKEVLETVLFLIRDATFMTGARLIIDGGYSLGHAHVPEMPAGVADIEISQTENLP